MDITNNKHNNKGCKTISFHECNLHMQVCDCYFEMITLELEQRKERVIHQDSYILSSVRANTFWRQHRGTSMSSRCCFKQGLCFKTNCSQIDWQSQLIYREQNI